MTKRTVVYTAGACKGYRGHGRWAWVVLGGRSNYGGVPDVTDYRMELRAMLEAIKSLKGELLIRADNREIANCFEREWWIGWENRGWRKSNNEPVKHQDLWRQIINAYKAGKFEFEWVEKLSGDPGNEAADTLARGELKAILGRGPTVVYTSGTCQGNPGPGGWAWVVLDGQTDSGGVPGSNRYRINLVAALEAIKSLDGELLIMTDSRHVFKCFEEEWWVRWEENNWLTTQKEPVMHQDLWRPIVKAHRQGKVGFDWVKRRSGDPVNEAAWKLARQAATELTS